MAASKDGSSSILPLGQVNNVSDEDPRFLGETLDDAVGIAKSGLGETTGAQDADDAAPFFLGDVARDAVDEADNVELAVMEVALIFLLGEAHDAAALLLGDVKTDDAAAFLLGDVKRDDAAAFLLGEVKADGAAAFLLGEVKKVEESGFAL